MPKVTKQSPNRPTPRGLAASNGRSVLDRLESFDVAERGIKLCLYGRSGTGKTRLACTFPTPLLMLGAEDGRKSVAGKEGCQFLRLKESEDVAVITRAIRDGELAVKTVVLDTAGGLQDLITREVLGLEDIPVQRNWGMADQQTWGIIGAQTKDRLRGLLDLSDRLGVHVVLIAHERNFKEEAKGPGSELLSPAVGASLTPSVAHWLHAQCDGSGQMFLQRKLVKKKTVVAGKESIREVDTGKVDYCMRVDTHPVYITRFRVPEGTVLPDYVSDPSYEKIARIMNGNPEG